MTGSWRGPGRWALMLLMLALLSGCASLSGLFGKDEDADEAGAGSGPAAEKQAAKRLVAAYELKVEAPNSELRSLLGEHLDLARFQRTEESERLSSIELDRLIATTPAEAKSLLETAGYFNAEVTMARPTPEEVLVQVQPGPRARVKTVEITFGGELQGDEKAQATLRRAWLLPPGEVFSQGGWSGAKAGVLRQARANGYPLARWSSTTAVVDAETNAAELRAELDSGPLFHLGELKIDGLKYHSTETIARLAAFTPGEPYSEKTLLDFQERLLKTQLFDSVSVEIQPDNGQSLAAPVFVRVREAARQQATTGIGYSANTGQRVTLEYLNRQPLGIPVRSKSTLDVSRELKSATVELSSYPQTDLHRNVASLSVEKDSSSGLSKLNLSARLGRVREAGTDELLSYLELVRAREDQTDGAITARAISLNRQWTRRRLDNLLLPTDGYQGLLLLGAGRADSSQAPAGLFGRAQLKLNGYKPVGSWFASARLELGQVLAADRVTIPEKLLFRAGGDESVRGYAYESLGPTRDGVEVGGRVLATGSIEIARPLARSLPNYWGAVFIDAGQAAQSWSDYKPWLGYGVGLRWRSPIGPLRIDIARGQEIHAWRLHFSVGITL